MSDSASGAVERPLEDGAEEPSAEQALIPGFGIEYNLARWSQSQSKKFLDQGRDWASVASFLAANFRTGQPPEAQLPQLARALPPPRPAVPAAKRPHKPGDTRATYAIELAYLGSAFHGFAWQKARPAARACRQMDFSCACDYMLGLFV